MRCDNRKFFAFVVIASVLLSLGSGVPQQQLCFLLFVDADCLPTSKSDDQCSLTQFSSYPGISIKYDPAKGGTFGNSQFEAIGDQINKPGNIVRQKVVDYLTVNADTFSNFQTDISWDDYLEKNERPLYFW